MAKVVRKTTKKQNGGYRSIEGAGPGRPKGSKNKFTSLKDTFLGVFEKMGGEEELLAWAKKSERNKAVFYGWITKMLPANVDFTGSQKIEFTVIYDKDAKDK